MPHPSEVYASDGTTQLAKLQLENRDPVSSLDEISPYVTEGTVATEDERFYEHGGFDLWGIARAAVVTLTGSGREGASTITQQFVRNTILSDEMTDISSSARCGRCTCRLSWRRCTTKTRSCSCT